MMGRAFDWRQLRMCAGRRHGSRILMPVLFLSLLACSGPDPAQTFAEAEASFAAHDYRTARIQLQNVLQADSQHLAARILFGRLALATGDVAEAERQLGVARDLGAAPADIAVPQAEIALARNEAEAGIALLDQVSSDSQDADYWRVRGLAELAAGDVALALGSFDRATALGGETSALLTARAQAAVGAGDLERAERLIDEALGLDADDPIALRFRSGLKLARGRFDEAATDLRAAADILQQRGQLQVAAPVLLQLVRLDLAAGDPESARATADRIVALAGGTSPLAEYALGLVAYATGAYPEAIRRMQAATNSVPDVPDFVTLLGAAHLAAGNLGQAEQAFRELLRLAPASVPAVRLLAETQIRQERPDAALESLRRIDAAAAPDAGVSLLRGVAHLQNGDAELAIVDLQQAVQGAPGNVPALVQLARAYNAAGRADEAAALLRASPLVDDDLTSAQDLQVVVSRLGAGDTAGAAAYVDELLAANPGDARAFTVAATYRRLVNERTAARENLDRALALDSAYVPAHLMLAALQAEEGLAEQAELRLQQVLELDPANQVALLSLAQMAVERGDLGVAERHLTTAVAAADSPTARLALARLHAATGDLDGARSDLRALAETAPGLEVLNLLADLELRLDNRAEALRLAGRMQTDFPRAPHGFALEARIRLLETEYADAARLFERALALDRSSSNFLGIVTARRALGQPGVEQQLNDWLGEYPEDAGVRAFLAETLLAGDRPAEALAQYERVLEGDADNVLALNNAAWIAHTLNRPGSLDYATRAAAAAPGNAAVLDTLGWILTQQGRPGEGIAHLERAAALSGDPAIRYHLAKAQADLGRAAEARTSLQEILQGGAAFPERAAAESLLDSL